jgi:hypothetical protein
LAWRLARGETDVAQKCACLFTWKPTQSELKAGKMHIQYSASRNKYVRRVGMEEIEGWENGTFQVKSIFRKKEKDWKVTYLARTGEITSLYFQYIKLLILMYMLIMTVQTSYKIFTRHDNCSVFNLIFLLLIC